MHIPAPLRARPRLPLLIGGALLGFAGNSLLCREALRAGRIDAATFTLVRMASGAAMLSLIASLTTRPPHRRVGGSWRSAAALAVYALAFSIAYVTLPTGTGALLLFGSVQLTMLMGAARAGDRLTGVSLVATLGAAAGLVWLLAPTAQAPTEVWASALMVAAGIGWGVFSLRGAGGDSALVATAGNFLRTLPAIVLAAVWLGNLSTTTTSGVLLALTSGMLTSGVAYALWFAALRSLRTSTAALLQLSVPVIATLGGALWLRETPTLRTLLAGSLVLGCVGLAIWARHLPVTGGKQPA
jgi:drug/metabolite transporter (DMT)-like permease